MGNLQDEGLSTEKVKHVDLSAMEIARYELQRGDILFNRTNSKELVGKCGLFDLDGRWVFASYLIRLRVDERRVSPSYISRFLMSAVGRRQIDRLSRQAIGMANINLTEIKGLLVPLPPLDIQKRISSALDEAWRLKASQLAKARNMERTLGQEVSTELNLSLDSQPSVSAFCAPLSTLKGGRLDVAANQPIPSLQKPLAHKLSTLGDIAEIDSERGSALGFSNEQAVPYVGLPECSLTAVSTIATRPAKEVSSASVARPGDILFARIEPSVFNQKYVLLYELPSGIDAVTTSGEFYVVRTNRNAVSGAYVYAVLFTEFLKAQISGRTTGSSGRRRIPRDLFSGLKLPLPSMSIQEEIGGKFLDKRSKAAAIREEAIERWNQAKADFDQHLRA
jgi:type I restriction enzyme S subunit